MSGFLRNLFSSVFAKKTKSGDSGAKNERWCSSIFPTKLRINRQPGWCVVAFANRKRMCPQVQIRTCWVMGDLQKGTCTTKEPVDLFDSRSLLEDERRGTEQLLREGYRFPEQEKWSNTTCTDCGNHVYKPTGVSRRYELPARSRKNSVHMVHNRTRLTRAELPPEIGVKETFYQESIWQDNNDVALGQRIIERKNEVYETF